MNGCVYYLLLVAAAKAQLVLPIVERPYLLRPPVDVKTFRLDSTRWAIVGYLEMTDWLDYAFDSLIEVRFRLYDEDKQILAETLLALPAMTQWEGHFLWTLSPTLSDKWIYLGVFPEGFPEKAYYTRVYLPIGIVQAYPLSGGAWLTPPVKVVDGDGHFYWVMSGDSLWGYFFEPARVDTAWPLLPYLFTKYTARWTYTPCAWYLKGDSSQVFWTCAFSGTPPKKLSMNPTRRAEAQKRFASSKPGDRTDFGLIYAAYGPPDLRIYTTTMETWVYTQQKLSFTFDRQGREWVLQRRIEYQAVWK